MTREGLLCWAVDLAYDGPMSSALKPPTSMNTADFLAWDAPWPGLWQLVDGEPVAMAPASRTHGALQSQLARLIANHLDADMQCSVVTAAGIIPRVRAEQNFRIPDLAVTCTQYEAEEYDVANPVLIIEILSPSNRSETWQNVWSFTTIPSLKEILVVSSTAMRADLLRRDLEGNWPTNAMVIQDGDLTLESIGLTLPLASIYRTTRLGRS